MLTQPKNVLVQNVELNWARLDTPAQNPFGGPDAWEVQIASSDRAALAELEELGAKVKEADGKFTISLRRKSTRADGSAMEPVRVVDANKAPMDGMTRRKIGNGSTGNVIVWAAPYTYANRTGVTMSLTAVQVTDLQEYTGGGSTVDFDVVGGSSDATEAPLF